MAAAEGLDAALGGFCSVGRSCRGPLDVITAAHLKGLRGEFRVVLSAAVLFERQRASLSEPEPEPSSAPRPGPPPTSPEDRRCPAGHVACSQNVTAYRKKGTDGQGRVKSPIKGHSVTVLLTGRGGRRGQQAGPRYSVLPCPGHARGHTHAPTHTRPWMRTSKAAGNQS